MARPVLLLIIDTASDSDSFGATTSRKVHVVEVGIYLDKGKLGVTPAQLPHLQLQVVAHTALKNAPTGISSR